MRSTNIPDRNRSIETADLSSGPKKTNWINRFTRYWSYLGMAVLMVMVLLVTIDVTGRYLFNKPIDGSNDIIEVMMVIMAFSSFAYGATENKHVRINFLYDKFPKVLKHYVDIFTSILSIFIVVLITWQLGKRAVTIIYNPPGPTTTYYGWDLMPFIAFAAFGFALLAIQLCMWLFQSVKQALGKDEHFQSALKESEAVLSLQK